MISTFAYMVFPPLLKIDTHVLVLLCIRWDIFPIFKCSMMWMNALCGAGLRGDGNAFIFTTGYIHIIGFQLSSALLHNPILYVLILFQ